MDKPKRPRGRPAQGKIPKSFTLSPEVLSTLERYADERRLSASWVVEEALRKYFNVPTSSE